MASDINSGSSPNKKNKRKDFAKQNFLQKFENKKKEIESEKLKLDSDIQ